MIHRILDISNLKANKLLVVILFVILLIYGISASSTIMQQKKELNIYSESIKSKTNENEKLQIEVEKYRAQYSSLSKQLETQQLDYDARISHLTDAINESNGYDNNLSLNNMNIESPTLVDSRLDKELVNMIIRHFEALYNGDLDSYKTTLASPEYEYLTSKVKSVKEPAKVKIISTNIEDNSYFEDFNQTGGQFIPVEVLTSDSETGEVKRDFYNVGVTKQSGDWLVYDYD